MPISRTLGPGDVGSMPPRFRPEVDKAQLYDLTKAQLIMLCELRGVTHDGKNAVSKYQPKAYYIERMKIEDKAGALTEDEREGL